MTVRTHTLFALLGVALAASACGSTASAASTKTVATTKTTSRKTICSIEAPQFTTHATAVTAHSCWVDGFFLDGGNLQTNEQIWTAKEANVLQYDLSPTIVNSPTKFAAWKKEAARVMTHGEVNRLINTSAPLTTSKKSALLTGLAFGVPKVCQLPTSPLKTYASVTAVEFNSPTTGKFTDFLSQVSGKWMLVDSSPGDYPCSRANNQQ